MRAVAHRASTNRTRPARTKCSEASAGRPYSQNSKHLRQTHPHRECQARATTRTTLHHKHKSHCDETQVPPPQAKQQDRALQFARAQEGPQENNNRKIAAPLQGYKRSSQTERQRRLLLIPTPQRIAPGDRPKQSTTWRCANMTAIKRATYQVRRKTPARRLSQTEHAWRTHTHTHAGRCATLLVRARGSAQWRSTEERRTCAHKHCACRARMVGPTAKRRPMPI